MGRDEALLCLENLFVLFDFIGYCYSEFYEEHSFDRKLILARQEKAKQLQNDFAKTKETLALHQQELVQKELDLKKLLAENASLKKELSARRQEQQQT